MDVGIEREKRRGSVALQDLADFETIVRQDNTCEAVDLTTGEPQYFYRAVEATTE